MNSRSPYPRRRCIGDGTERVREVLHLEAPPGPEQRQDVVTEPHAGMRRGVLIAQPDEPLALAPVDRLEAFSRRARLPRLHLDDGDRVAAPDDQIDLARVQPQVA